jgi:hypothetical protein
VITAAAALLGAPFIQFLIILAAFAVGLVAIIEKGR